MVSKKEKEIIDALADLDPEMAAMLSVQQRIANDPTRIPNIFNPGQVLQGIQDYTGRQSTSGIISDARNMTPEEFQRQFGISNTYTRALADAQDAARRGEARAMPDSEARAERERQSIESLQSQITANVAEQKRKDDLAQKLLDDLNRSAARAAAENVRPGPGSARAAAERADYTQPLPEGTGWWDETAGKVTQREVREINERYGPLLKQSGLGPVTSLDEFLNLVRQERNQPGGGIGLYGQIYGAQFPLDNWGIFGPPRTTDPRLTSNNPFGQGPLTATPQGVPTPTNMQDGSGSLLSTALGGLPDMVTGGANWLLDLLRGAGTQNRGTYGGPQGVEGDYSLPRNIPIDVSRGYSSAGWTPASNYPVNLFGMPNFDAPIPPATDKETDVVVDEETDESTDPRSLSDKDAERRFRDAATKILQGQPLDSVFGTLRHSNSLTLQIQSEALQLMQQQLTGLEAAGIRNDAARLQVVEDSIRLAMDEGQYQLNKMEADRTFAFEKQKLQLEALRAQEEGRQFNQELLFGYRQAATDVDEANRQLEFQRYQTSIENPFNVAAFNLLSGPPEVRTASSARQSGVTQSHLNDALRTAQHHAGRQGIGIDDPQIQRIAAQLVNQTNDPVQKAAMQSIAQGVSNLSVTPTTQPTTGQSQNIFRNALQQQGQTQPMSPTTTQPSSTQTFIPQGLQDINFSPGADVRFGQPTDYSSLFKGGLPTLGDIGKLSTAERGFLESTAASTGTSREDLMKRAADITPTVQGMTMPQVSRIRNRYTGRNSGGAF